MPTNKKINNDTATYCKTKMFRVLIDLLILRYPYKAPTLPIFYLCRSKVELKVEILLLRLKSIVVLNERENYY